MAGTIVADTIQDGAGNSTSMDNAIYGSAKAWARWGTSSATIASSYNVSSITRNSVGDYTVNFTNAFSDANYNAIANCAYAAGVATAFAAPFYSVAANAYVAPTASTLRVSVSAPTTATGYDSNYIGVSIFR